jgi:beta-lactamase class A
MREAVLLLAVVLFASALSGGQQQLFLSNGQLQNRITQIASRARGRVGVFTVIHETNEVVASLNTDSRFPMQSVYKLPISMAVMKQVTEGRINLDQSVQITKQDYGGLAGHSPIRDRYPNGTELTVNELIRFALSESDGTASDVLMRLAGGPQAIQSFLDGLGIKDMIVLDTEKALIDDTSLQYRNYSTPKAAVEVLRALQEKRGVSASSQELLLQYMVQSTPGPRRLKGLLPPGTITAHKTGTSLTEKGITAATNDIGIITLPNGRHLIIAVFVSDSPADLVTRESVIARLAKVIFDASISVSHKEAQEKT